MALTIEPLSTVFWELRLRAWLAHAASRARAEENRPHWVSAVLIVLILVESIHAVLLIVRAPAAIPAPVTVQELQRAARFHPPRGVNAQLIVAAHLFGVVPPRGNLNPADAVPTTAALKLFGTIAHADPTHGFAILEADGQQRLYRVGEDVGGASLYLVYLTRVLLNRDGQLESLSLPRFNPLGQPMVAVPMPAKVFSGPPEEAGEHHVGAMLRTEAAVDDDSDKLLGFRIAPMPPAMRFTRAGLRPQDLVTAVNGTPLNDQDRQHSQQVLNTALAANSVTLTILRDGQSIDVSVAAPE